MATAKDAKDARKKAFERRQLSRAGQIDVREVGDSVSEIVGYAAVFNQPAYGEVLRPGAFTKTLQERQDVRAYWSHDMAQPIGRTTNGTLELRQDEAGLWVRIVANRATTWGRDALEAVRSGLVSQFSFGFRVINGGMEVVDGDEVFAITEVALYEVSPVAEPWYEGTSAEARALWAADDAAGAPGPVDDGHSTLAAQRMGARIDMYFKLNGEQ